MQARTTVCYLLPGERRGLSAPRLEEFFSTGTRITRLPFMLRPFWQPSHSPAKSRHGVHTTPARSSSAGFSLCGFDFCTNGNAHRLKSVLLKPASHRNAIRRIKLTTESRFSLRACEERRPVDARSCLSIVSGHQIVHESTLRAIYKN